MKVNNIKNSGSFKANIIRTTLMQEAAIKSKFMSENGINPELVKDFALGISKIKLSREFKNFWMLQSRSDNQQFVVESERNNQFLRLPLSFKGLKSYSNLDLGLKAMQAIAEYGKTINDISDQSIDLSEKNIKEIIQNLVKDFYDNNTN